MYALQIVGHEAAFNFDPLDSTTYFLANANYNPGTTEESVPLHIRRSGTIVAASVTILRDNEAPSGESVTINIRINETTTVLVETKAMTGGASPVIDEFLNSSLSQAVSPGDRIRFSFVTPAWATNPSRLVLAGYILIEDTTERETVTSNDSEISANLAAVLTNDSDISGLVAGTLGGALTAAEATGFRTRI